MRSFCPLNNNETMTPAGWLMMILVVGSMTSLLIWCSWKVVTTPDSSEHIHPPIELDTPDMHETE